MKTLKRMFAVMLAVVMMMGLGVTSMAREAVYDSSVPVTFEVEEYPDSDQYVEDKLPSGDDWTVNYQYNKDDGKTALDAISYAAGKLSNAAFDTGINKDGDTYINSIFTLPTINNYGTNSWEGYYWKIIVTGLDENGREVTFDSPVYANKIPLGKQTTFTNEYDKKFPITCTVKSITMRYCYESMSW